MKKILNLNVALILILLIILGITIATLIYNIGLNVY